MLHKDADHKLAGARTLDSGWCEGKGPGADGSGRKDCFLSCFDARQAV